MILPFETSHANWNGGEVIFEDVLACAIDVIVDVLAPVNFTDVEIESSLVGRRKLFGQFDRVLTDETPLAQHVEAYARDGSVSFVVKTNLHSNIQYQFAS